MACRFPHSYGRERENNQPRSPDSLMKLALKAVPDPGRDGTRIPSSLALCEKRVGRKRVSENRKKWKVEHVKKFRHVMKELTWEDTQGLHCKYPQELHTIPYNFVIRNCMELSRRLFFISLGAADFVTYDQREVFFPTPFCQENVIIWKQTRHDRVGRLKPPKIKGFSSSISEVSFV